jgi:hypothetical protein
MALKLGRTKVKNQELRDSVESLKGQVEELTKSSDSRIIKEMSRCRMRIRDGRFAIVLPYIRMLHGLKTSGPRMSHYLLRKTRLLRHPKASKHSILSPSPAMAASNSAIGAMDPKNATADRVTRHPNRNREKIPEQMARSWRLQRIGSFNIGDTHRFNTRR